MLSLSLELESVVECDESLDDEEETCSTFWFLFYVVPVLALCFLVSLQCLEGLIDLFSELSELSLTLVSLVSFSILLIM